MPLTSYECLLLQMISSEDMLDSDSIKKGKEKTQQAVFYFMSSSVGIQIWNMAQEILSHHPSPLVSLLY